MVVLSGVKRITPAYAGKSSGTVRGTLRSRDHPRLCGEKPQLIEAAIDMIGSPPPMRGKGTISPVWNCTSRITPAYAGKSVSSFDCRFCAGITPAYAGKRRSACVKMSLSQDHPRLCGEKQSGCRYTTHQQGSPPPMRGKGTVRQGSNARTRITPAYAGKSPSRWEGVNAVIGSPPPMRGKVSRKTCRSCHLRITPA